MVCHIKDPPEFNLKSELSFNFEVSKLNNKDEIVKTQLSMGESLKWDAC